MAVPGVVFGSSPLQMQRRGKGCSIVIDGRGIVGSELLVVVDGVETVGLDWTGRGKTGGNKREGADQTSKAQYVNGPGPTLSQSSLLTAAATAAAVASLPCIYFLHLGRGGSDNLWISFEHGKSI